MQYYLGVDPGVTTGWAIVSRDGPALDVIDYDQGPGGKQLLRALDAVPNHARVTHNGPPEVPLTLVVESQFIAPLSMLKHPKYGHAYHAKARDALKIATYAGRWWQMAEVMQWLVFWGARNRLGVLPEEWRAGIYGRGQKTPSSDVAKKMACEYVALIYQIELEPREHHAAEAVLIASWAAGEAKLQRGGLQ